MEYVESSTTASCSMTSATTASSNLPIKPMLNERLSDLAGETGRGRGRLIRYPT